MPSTEIINTGVAAALGEPISPGSASMAANKARMAATECIRVPDKTPAAGRLNLDKAFKNNTLRRQKIFR
jgi:hypothetical protein